MAALLVLLAAVSGLVDAVGYLTLGHVFVANMTGNMLFVAFALAGVTSVSLASSVVALGCFTIGAVAAGRLAGRGPYEKAALLSAMTAIELSLVIIAIGLGLTGTAQPSPVTYGMVAVMAAAMGVQSATTTRLQIAGFNSTVVFTTMLSTLAASSRLAGGSGADNGRRMLAIASMLIGGLLGALLILRASRVAPLLLAALVLLTVSVGVRVIARQSTSKS